MLTPPCRACGAPLTERVIDLGVQPLSNALVRPEDALKPEPTLALDVRACPACRWVQLAASEAPAAIFADDYAYFSSYAESWVAHAKAYAEAMIARLGLGAASQVVEVASNDGYLLQWLVRAGVPALGIEPAANVAAAAEAKGVPTRIAFFGRRTAEELAAEGIAADLIAANNVLAHVPDPGDFVAGFRILLKPDGIATFEFPHLLRLLADAQFDTIYHEHYSYISLLALEPLLARHGLRAVDVERLATHGGSLRLFVARAESRHAETPALAELRAEEAAAGLAGPAGYAGLAPAALRIKEELVEFLIAARRAGRRVVGYGAPAKGATLLNYCGIGPDHLPFTVDRSPRKQGRLMPGCRVPIRAPEALFAARPDYVLILPWNLREEIASQLSEVRAWGGRLFTPVPRLEAC